MKLLRCEGNQITQIDISNNTLLCEIAVQNNKLKELDIRNCPALCRIVEESERCTDKSSGFDYYDKGFFELDSSVSVIVDQAIKDGSA